MKKLTITAVLFCMTLNSYSQTAEEKKYSELYKVVLETLLGDYKYAAKKTKIKSQVISPDLLSTELRSSFNTVAFGSSNLVKNSSAFGYSQNEDKTDVSASANFKLPYDFKGAHYITSGVYGQGASNVFDLYGSETWQNNVGGNIGYVWQFAGAKFFDTDEYKQQHFDKDFNLRRTYASAPVYDIKKYSQSRLDEIQMMLNEINQKINDHTYKLVNKELKQMLLKKSYFEAEKKLYQEREKILKFKAIFETKIKKLDKDFFLQNKDYQDAQLQKWGNRKYSPLNMYIRKQLAEFDSIINPTYGYSFHWLAFNASVSNSTYKFKDENIDSSAAGVFKESYDIDDSYNSMKTSFSLKYNYTRKTKNYLLFLQFGKSLNRGSILENNLIAGTPTIEGSQLTFVNNDSVFGSLNELEETILRFGSFDFYGAIFFGQKQTVGFNVSYNHYYNIGSLPANNYFFENHFTCFFGPVFRKIKDDKTSVTFGIDVGWENVLYKTQINDDFVTRVRLGIPFTIFK